MIADNCNNTFHLIYLYNFDNEFEEFDIMRVLSIVCYFRKGIIADFTIVLESEHIENNTAKLVKALIDLKAGETLMLQGKTVQAKSSTYTVYNIFHAIFIKTDIILYNAIQKR